MIIQRHLPCESRVASVVKLEAISASVEIAIERFAGEQP